MRYRFRILLGLAWASWVCAAGEPRVSALQWQRRVLLIAAPAAADVELLEQRRLLAAWTGAADRDVTVVEITGNTVAGASDDAAELRRRYGLTAGRFTAVLLGKDGHVAIRSSRPLQGETLQGTIDAMPMRRAGER